MILLENTVSFAPQSTATTKYNTFLFLLESAWWIKPVARGISQSTQNHHLPGTTTTHNYTHAYRLLLMSKAGDDILKSFSTLAKWLIWGNLSHVCVRSAEQMMERFWMSAVTSSAAVQALHIQRHPHCVLSPACINNLSTEVFDSVKWRSVPPA